PIHIAEDLQFENLRQVWLQGDHYKWRAMRANGVDESYITGDRPDWEKFEKWAETVPNTLRNPLYHWTHLELQRYFGINELLNKESARRIYDECTQKLQTKEYSVRNLLRKMKVQLICTTDDPADSLEYHKKIKEEPFGIEVIPGFRPDAALKIEDPILFNTYISKLGKASGIQINSFPAFLDALRARHDFFASMGCIISDHGLEHMYAEDYTVEEIHKIFKEVSSGQEPTEKQSYKFKSAVLKILAQWNHEKGWVQQYHLGAIRNTRSRIVQSYGVDSGCDSIGDFSQAKSLANFLDGLDQNNQLAKTILYNLNPSDNEMVAAMAGNFNDGTTNNKVQYGPAWWFLDQKDGILRQLNALSNMGLLNHFVGMITDSRSFLSFPRHEYFRRILCDLFGTEMENGELPHDLEWIGKVIQNICYNNALHYFNFKVNKQIL
ncbi:MAG TPA: glucuronate isomerase, partial [Flavisolibacter sp.]|nr:glucuronate isomerase [Flavisolibacter sp.]